MDRQVTEHTPFPGFPDFRANVTFTPIQFFTVVLPHCKRCCVRLVGYALRKVLGWVDARGNPTRERLRLSYRELEQAAGVSHDVVPAAIAECLDAHCLRQVEGPRPAETGQSGRSGVYELCWDKTGAYTDSPDDFRGFYYPEAALLPVTEGGRVVRRPKAARKNIPNAFFDYVLPREPLAVIRVVGALLFYSIQWGPGGERKRPVKRSITELCRLTRMTRSNVHAAVTQARERGYIVAVNEGRFTPVAGQKNRTTTYAIRWSRDPGLLQAAAAGPDQHPRALRPAQRSAKANGELSEKENGGALRKRERKLSEKENEELSEKENDISIKKELKTSKTTAAAAEVIPDAPVAAAAIALLVQVGFDTPTADRLAQGHSPEVIQRQIDWLPLRRSSRNRLGLLRRAIEEDWPKPEGGENIEPDLSQARTFASHYYAAYHRLEGPAGTKAFPKDIEEATRFLARLQGLESRPVAAWGRRFGRFMREKHAADPHAKPNLSFALVLHGDGFLRMLQGEDATRTKDALERARAAHEATFSPRWQAYLRAAEADLQERHPALYDAFRQGRERVRRAMSGRVFVASAETLARFEGEPARLAALAQFFHNHPQCPVLDFWQWDRERNPDRFETKTRPATDGSTGEVPR